MAVKPKSPTAPKPTEVAHRHYCSQPIMPQRTLPMGLDRNRAEAIILTRGKWANGTALKYYFFDKPADGALVGPKAQMDAVRRAFKTWKDLGLGLQFAEVADRSDAHIRIGFDQTDGSWSYVGTQSIEPPVGRGEQTMNFGWDLTTADGFDTALHEIGHALGLPHEHQNPNAGIVWNEEAVYAALAAPPNRWSRDKTFHNIIRKLPPDSVKGSNWDPDSVMHYPFESGLIKKPDRYANGLTPAGGLSPADKAWVLSFYPTLVDADMPALTIGASRLLKLENGKDQAFVIHPTETRKYNIQVFGDCDAQLVLDEHRDGTWQYVAQDDDSGESRNATFNMQLVKGRKYCVRVRMRYSGTNSSPALMLW